jgi:hypothetical protein
MNRMDIPEQKCPKCGWTVNAVTTAGGKTLRLPDPGDLNICMRCFAVNQFGEGLMLQTADLEKLSMGELLELATMVLSLQMADLKMKVYKAGMN